MPKAPLQFEHMAAISETLDAFSRTGADTVESLHYARENPTRNLKYWRAAMKAAGFVK